MIDKELSDKAIEELQLMSMEEPETAHSGGDAILCRLLYDLGYSEVVKAYGQIDRYFA